MAELDNVSIMIRHYKCFGAEGGGFEQLLPINLIIGKNNSGKSALLDILHYACKPYSLEEFRHKSGEADPQVLFGDVLENAELQQVFRRTEHHDSIPSFYNNNWEFGKQWIGKQMTWEFVPETPNDCRAITICPPFDIREADRFERHLARIKKNPFGKFHFKRLLPNRDIVPEDDTNDLTVSNSGQGSTRVIHRFLSQVSLPSELVEKRLLKELNSIFEPEGSFTRILSQQHEGGKWELFLEEEGKGRIPLTHSGSGIKTILLVLVFLILVPYIEKKTPLSNYLFGFEELENNLHPALQRRLLLYLRETAIKEHCKFFLTTHSSVAIDLFASDKEAQILHVTHNREQASVKRVITYAEHKGILGDLDMRASDLLQANGIVWLEGPSDRLYFNRWIQLWSEEKLREGAHYQCVFYGGRLLAHLSADDPTVDSDEVVKILRVNRNAIVLIDSDKREESQPINKTKQRICEEVKSSGGMAWVTNGREVENYIPRQALISHLDEQDLPQVGQYQDFAEYLDGIRKNEGSKFLRNKVLFAEQIVPHIMKKDLMSTLDLDTQLATACQVIRSWNGQKEPI